MRFKSNNRTPRPEERREAPRLEGRATRALLRLIGAALLALFVALPAHAQSELVAGYDVIPARGPEQAKGAVIWNHGLSRLTEAAGETPFVVDHLQAAGWDVFRLQRRWASDRMDTSPAALVDAATQLRKQGYRKIVSSGQSFGAWISFAAAAQASGLIDAIVAFAPAAHGEFGVSPVWERNAEGLYEVIDGVGPSTRVLTFFFNNDNLDPGGRAPRLNQIFSDHKVPHSTIDRPPGFSGHGVGLTHAFAHVYGACVVAFIEAAAIPKDFSCARYLRTDPGRGFALPPDIRIVPAPPEALPGLAKMVGRWYGWYDVGRQVMLVIDEVGRDRALAYYATTALFRTEGDRGATTRRKGEFDPATGILRFSEMKHTPLQFRLRPDGKLDATWSTVDGRFTLTTVLRRVD
jgi:hypothetical protein